MGPKLFWIVHISLNGSNLFCLGPNHYRSKFLKIVHKNLMWTWPKWFGPDQDNFNPSRTIWTVQNNLGPIEGQGISILYWSKNYWKQFIIFFWCKMAIFKKGSCANFIWKFRFLRRSQKFGLSSTLFFWHDFAATNYKWKMGQVFVTFSEYLKFTYNRNLTVFVIQTYVWK